MQRNGAYTHNKHIAYNEQTSPEIVYVFVDEEHIGEELRSVVGRFKGEKSFYAVKTLVSIKKQLHLAGAAMRASGDGFYLFDEVSLPTKDEKDESDNILLLTLCAACLRRFRNAGMYIIRRANRKQEGMGRCTYGNDGLGWDYKLTPKDENKKN